MHATQNTPASVEAERTPAGVLRGAAAYLQTHGWHQGARYDLRGEITATPPACAAGAIYTAAYGCALADLLHTPEPTPDQWQSAQDALYTFATTLPGYDSLRRPSPEEERELYDAVIGGWNDRPDRTLTQVTTALHDAADQWEHRQPGGAS
jgi:hypothetical protein